MSSCLAPASRYRRSKSRHARCRSSAPSIRCRCKFSGARRQCHRLRTIRVWHPARFVKGRSNPGQRASRIASYIARGSRGRIAATRDGRCFVTPEGKRTSTNQFAGVLLRWPRSRQRCVRSGLCSRTHHADKSSAEGLTTGKRARETSEAEAEIAARICFAISQGGGVPHEARNARTVELLDSIRAIDRNPLVHPVACTRFRGHRVRCHSGAGGGLWNANVMHESSSLRL